MSRPSKGKITPLPEHMLLDLTADPFDLFTRWMKEADANEPHDPNAMSVATATADGRPSVRIVLLKGVSRRGFVFYTNKDSRKGEELAQNPYAALLFYWKSLRRQIRIEGRVESVTNDEADAYFASRSRISRLGAIASDQSRHLEKREIFEERLTNLQAQYSEGDVIPRPQNWSGYRVVPDAFEFWQEQPHRLHDRARWVAQNDPEVEREARRWSVERLYP
ncbi:pyridoxamine 5'-phosphate oxidase [Acetobacteraceae bacterium ESL0709]|nr:pyridoxamine 5'-phosphate oxidase [Acetobacteraceae bacterium ESL0697]MDF7678239.1 pyridoxamine 5'-phosphate oxidase [Acetobacteraceae bacterium ESL0709]